MLFLYSAEGDVAARNTTVTAQRKQSVTMRRVTYYKMGTGWINKADAWKHVRVNMVLVDFYTYSDGFTSASRHGVRTYEGCSKNNM